MTVSIDELSSPSTSTTVGERESKELSRFRKRLGTEMNQIIPNLYLGSLRDATDVEQLVKYNIKHIVAVHELTLHHSSHHELGIDTLRIQLPDCSSAQIYKYFGEAIVFIHRARIRGESVLVHCLAGVSRSATVVTAYLVTISEISYFNALSHVQSKRPLVNPNFGFRMQLCKYAEKMVNKERERLQMEFGLDFDSQWTKDRQSLGHKSDLCLYIPGNSLSESTSKSFREGTVDGSRNSQQKRMRSATTQVFRCDLDASSIQLSIGKLREEGVQTTIKPSQSISELFNNIAFIDE